MIIKKWNASLAGTDKWEAQAVETTAQSIKTTMGGTAIFDSNNKILPNHLPDSVYDSLYFYGTAATSISSNLSHFIAEGIDNSYSLNRSLLGYYWVVSIPGTFNAQNTETTVTISSGLINVTAGSSELTLTAGYNTNKLRVGMIVSGTNIPTNATITSIKNSTTFVISAPVTVPLTSSPIIFRHVIKTIFSSAEENHTYTRVFTLEEGSDNADGSTAYLQVGMSVSGTGIPNGTTIIAIDGNGTELTLSEDATEDGPQTLTFQPSVITTQLTQTLEAGDWFIVTKQTGSGIAGNPFVFTIAPVNNTYEIMKGATSTTAGAPGIVPAPLAGQEELYLKGNGGWGTPTNTTYSEISTGEIDSGTDTTLRTITGRRAQHLLRNNVTETTTANLATGATINGAAKTVNLGTAGVSNSTTTINIGSAVAGALGTTTINSPTTNVKNLVSASTQTTGSIVSITGNSLTDGNALLIQSDRPMNGSLLNVTGTGAMTSGDLAKFQNNAYVGSTTSGLVDVISTSTARAAGSQLIRVASSGANGTASREVIGGVITVTNTGTSSTNTALQLTASGGTAANRALVVTAGDTVLAGDVAVNGGDITTSATTFNLIDATATTVNAFGAATSLNLGNDGTGAASTTNIATGAISTALTKAINIGTGGSGTSTTTITLGSATDSSQLIINSTDTKIRAAATTSAATYFPVFTADPTTTGREIKHRTAAEVRGDIGALATSLATNTAPADGQHLMITSSDNVIQQSSITFDTTVTDTFLRRDGSFATPVGTQYTAGEGLTLTGTAFSQTYPVYHADSLPTSGISDNAIGFEW